jgi:hypothetical protein
MAPGSATTCRARAKGRMWSPQIADWCERGRFAVRLQNDANGSANSNQCGSVFPQGKCRPKKGLDRILIREPYDPRGDVSENYLLRKTLLPN